MGPLSGGGLAAEPGLGLPEGEEPMLDTTQLVPDKGLLRGPGLRPPD
jgi:hypothetical protein